MISMIPQGSDNFERKSCKLSKSHVRCDGQWCGARLYGIKSDDHFARSQDAVHIYEAHGAHYNDLLTLFSSLTEEGTFSEGSQSYKRLGNMKSL
jgi:hypothetical protein